jgi:subtilisin family serine protease
VLNCAGSGSGSGLIAGLDYIRNNGAKPGVINLSLGFRPHPFAPPSRPSFVLSPRTKGQ